MNQFSLAEWAGAFGDLGTLIPFVVGYIASVGVNPVGILVAFGVSLIACGIYYRTPVPVQPMKALGAAAIAHATQGIAISASMLTAAGLLTGAIWLILGLTGSAARLARLVPRFVVVGIVLGLGMAFMVEAIKMMSSGWLASTIGLVGTLMLLANRRVPAMFLVLALGICWGACIDPEALHRITQIKPTFHTPSLNFPNTGWIELALGALILVIPQLPLTLGNAVIATSEENNRLFPDRPTSENQLALSTGLMNLLAAPLGGIPMCHGAGGMAGHVAFGARTGGAPIILGAILLMLGLFLGDSVSAIFAILPTSFLGVILFMTGAQLALGSCDFSKDKRERLVTLVTAAFCIWNVGVAFLAGLVGAFLIRRNLLRI